jgi:hypothetical protein
VVHGAMGTGARSPHCDLRKPADSGFPICIWKLDVATLNQDSLSANYM